MAMRAWSSSTDSGSRSCLTSKVSGSPGLSGKSSSRSMAPESADRTLVSIASATYPQISCPLCDRWALAWTAGAELPGGLIVGHDPAPAPAACFRLRIALDRSEEHTSELQSLMRLSYAVFRLKKTTKT